MYIFISFFIIFVSITNVFADSSVDEILSASQKALQWAEKIEHHQPKDVCRLKDENMRQDKSSHSQENLLIFVSSSLSPQVLKNLFRDVSQVGGKLIFKGLINNSFKDTYHYFKEIQINADIDPNKFDDYQVSVVPTFILKDKQEKRFDRLQGNVSLDEALTQFKDRGELKSFAQNLLKKGRKF
jgi:type-F conjugative transfer system pilin assembly protein TrbC